MVLTKVWENFTLEEEKMVLDKKWNPIGLKIKHCGK
jgi:hypothetical protein